MVTLNGDFGVVLEQVLPDDLDDPVFRARAYDLWFAHGGLLAVRYKYRVSLWESMMHTVS